MSIQFIQDRAKDLRAEAECNRTTDMDLEETYQTKVRTVEALEQIAEAHREQHSGEKISEMDAGIILGLEVAAAKIASIFRDHPEYDPEWESL